MTPYGQYLVMIMIKVILLGQRIGKLLDEKYSLFWNSRNQNAVISNGAHHYIIIWAIDITSITVNHSIMV
jgi:hypothetical protein